MTGIHSNEHNVSMSISCLKIDSGGIGWRASFVMLYSLYESSTPELVIFFCVIEQLVYNSLKVQVPLVFRDFWRLEAFVYSSSLFCLFVEEGWEEAQEI